MLMKAVVYKKYGSPEVLHLEEIEKPTPKDNEVLIKIYATTVTSADCRVRSLNVPTGFGLIMRLVFGIRKPRQPILGMELAGVVAALGKDVMNFKMGDPVFAFSDTRMGCYAEYKSMPEDGVVLIKPASLSYDEAAALAFGGTTAMSFLRRAKLQCGEKVLINGASGNVGSAAVQIARHFGAEVTGVCSAANVALVKSLGASHVIDYSQEDFTQNGETYDVIVDTVGRLSFSRCKASLKQGGRLLMLVAGLPEMLKAPWLSMMSGKKVIAGPAAVRVEDLHRLARLAEAGEFKPLIDRRYPFEQIVDAHRYVNRGHKKGSVIVTLGANASTLGTATTLTSRVRPASAAVLLCLSLAGCASVSGVTTSVIADKNVEHVVMGSGSPTVVFENGLGGQLEWWAQVLPVVSKETQVFAYNRPGIGDSAAVSTPRDGETVIRELRTLLQARGITPPYVLVGHSLGGLYMQLYARRYPNEVAGLVLVDATHPEQLKGAGSKENWPGWFKVMLEASLSEAALKELEAIPATGSEMLALPAFSGKPVIVLSAQKPMEDTSEMAKHANSKRVDIARLHPGAKQVWVDSGHAIPLENPQAVIAAVQEVLSMVRAQSTAKQAQAQP